MPESSAGERTAVYKAMLGTLVQLHSVDWKALGLDSMYRGDNYVERQVSSTSGPTMCDLWLGQSNSNSSVDRSLCGGDSISLHPLLVSIMLP